MSRGMRYGPTTVPSISTRPLVTSVKYSRTEPVPTTPSLKNRSSKCCCVSVIGSSSKSTSTTATRTTPCSGVRSAAAERTLSIEVPRGKWLPGTISPSLKPGCVGRSRIAPPPTSRTRLRLFSRSDSFFILVLRPGLGGTMQRSSAGRSMISISLSRSNVSVLAIWLRPVPGGERSRLMENTSAPGASKYMKFVTPLPGLPGTCADRV